MKQILPKLKQVNSHLSFLRKCFTKRGFRHVICYINGLITLNRKTVKQISKASIDEIDQSLLNRILTEACFNQQELEERYLKKIAYLTKGYEISLIFDDTLVERNGKKVEETQSHKDHTNNDFLTGHEFFTSIIYTYAIQLPLLPKLYSKNTDSKIEMALNLIDFVMERMKIHNVIMDSWYSDKKIIKKCMTKGIRVVCGIKCNRRISLKRGEWLSLSGFSKEIPEKDLALYFIDEVKYKIAEYKTKLNGIPCIKMLASYEWNEKHKKYNNIFYLISTNKKDTAAQILRRYRIRWFIETYHRDIKQNLGFAKLFLRRKEGIVRHAIFASIAYAALKLFMFLRGLTMTIGECCAHIQDREMDDFIREIIEIEDKETRIKIFEEVFIRETAKV
jgi:hypothetical protein